MGRANGSQSTIRQNLKSVGDKTIPGSNPRGEVSFSVPVQKGPEGKPANCIMFTGSLPGVKRPGRGIDHPPSPSAQVVLVEL